MNSFTLNNGITMPALGFGTFKMNGEECAQSVAEAIRCGYRMIDTAEAYKNEEAVGAGIAEGGVPRGELFIVTKVNFRSYPKTRETVEASLKKLRTDYLDLVLLHWPLGDYYAAWRELEKLYAEGVVRAIGVSNFNPDRLLCQRRAEREWMDKYGVRCMAYAPLGQGRRNEMFENAELTAVAAAHGKSPAQTALRFLMQSGAAVVPKSSHAERIAENAALFDLKWRALKKWTPA